METVGVKERQRINRINFLITCCVDMAEMTGADMACTHFRSFFRLHDISTELLRLIICTVLNQFSDVLSYSQP